MWGEYWFSLPLWVRRDLTLGSWRPLAHSMTSVDGIWVLR